MKIVIIGEYSSFAKNLSKGFKALGHSCLVFSWGDGFKKIEADETTIKIPEDNFKLWGRQIKDTHFIKAPYLNYKIYRCIQGISRDKADIVLVSNIEFLRDSEGFLYKIFNVRFSYKMLCSIVKDQSNIYMSSCGNDYVINKFLPLFERPNEYAIFKFNKKIEKEKIKFEHYIRYIHKIIPIAYDYEKAYRNFENDYKYTIYNTIPLPYDTTTAEFNNKVNGKINILHGINRPYEKGSYIIISALDRIKRLYGEKVSINIVYQLSLNEYLKIMSEANIVIDQCYGLSNGMNTIEALSMGKVVLTGNKQDYQKCFTSLNNPVLNIYPNSDQIYSVLEDLILHPNKIEEISVKSRHYAESVHDAKIVADQYLKIFEKSL